MPGSSSGRSFLNSAYWATPSSNGGASTSRTRRATAPKAPSASPRPRCVRGLVCTAAKSAHLPHRLRAISATRRASPHRRSPRSSAETIAVDVRPDQREPRQAVAQGCQGRVQAGQGQAAPHPPLSAPSLFGLLPSGAAICRVCTLHSCQGRDAGRRAAESESREVAVCSARRFDALLLKPTAVKPRLLRTRTSDWPRAVVDRIDSTELRAASSFCARWHCASISLTLARHAARRLDFVDVGRLARSR